MGSAKRRARWSSFPLVKSAPETMAATAIVVSRPLSLLFFLSIFMSSPELAGQHSFLQHSCLPPKRNDERLVETGETLHYDWDGGVT